MSKHLVTDTIVSQALDIANTALANSLGDARVRYWHGELIAIVGEYMRVTAYTGSALYGGTVRGDIKRRDVVATPYALASNARVFARYAAGRASIPDTALASLIA